MPASPGRATTPTSGRSPRRYRLAPPAGALDSQGGLVWWEPAQGCWVSARFLLDGRLVERRHERLAEVVHALEGDGAMTDQVLLAGPIGGTCQDQALDVIGLTSVAEESRHTVKLVAGGAHVVIDEDAGTGGARGVGNPEDFKEGIRCRHLRLVVGTASSGLRSLSCLDEGPRLPRVERPLVEHVLLRSGIDHKLRVLDAAVSPGPDVSGVRDDQVELVRLAMVLEVAEHD